MKRGNPTSAPATERQMHLGRLLFPLLLLLIFSSCGPARRGEPFTDLQLTEVQLQGREKFMHHCHQCHPGGGAGLGPAINNKPLPKWLIRWQVRHGIGAMPSFTEDRISDSDLARIIDFLKALRAESRS